MTPSGGRRGEIAFFRKRKQGEKALFSGWRQHKEKQWNKHLKETGSGLRQADPRSFKSR